MPTLEPIVVNPPKEKKTYTYSENDIVDIVAQAIKQGKIEALAGFEEVEIKLYLSDLDQEQLQDGVILLANQEKVAQIERIAELVNNSKIVIGKYETPEYSYSDSNYKDIAVGTVNYGVVTGDAVLTFGETLKYNDNEYRPQFAFAVGGLIVAFISHPSALITLLATDTTKYISLKFRVEK